MKITNWKRKLAASLIAAGLMSPVALHAAPLDTNLVANPSFEDAGALPGDAAHWTLQTVTSLERIAGFGPVPHEAWEGFERWSDLPEALARRLVQRALRALGAGRDLSRVHLMRVLEFLREGPAARGGAWIELPGGLRLHRSRDRYLLTRIREIAAPPC